MTKRFSLFLAMIVFAGLFVALPGCDRDPLDPTQIGRFRPTPAVSIILESLGVADEDAPKFVDAQEPEPIDLVELQTDYVLSIGDFVTVNIFELLEEGVPYSEMFEISESGNISIPEVGQIQAIGLTEVQLEEELKNILYPTILKNPSITVRLEQSRSRAFTILGEGIPRAGRYLLPGYTYRLADALADAGSSRQFNVDYIYVMRYDSRYLAPRDMRAGTKALDFGSTKVEEHEVDVKEIKLEPIEGGSGSRDELLEIIAPYANKNGKPRGGAVMISAAEAAGFEELKSLAAPEELGFEIDIASEVEVPAVKVEPMKTRTEWIFEDGKWVAVEVADESAEVVLPKQPVARKAREQVDVNGKLDSWNEMMEDDQTRVLKIPIRRIGVDPRYNIVIRPGDIITVPFNVVGEAVVMGNVNRPGYIDLTGRPMTLIQAIAAAGGLGQLAEPSRVEVRRRIGDTKEQIISVNLDKIARGLQPDFFIKQDDTINVGTLPTSSFAAVLRNAFRATYGFGFIYDKNFADRDFGDRAPIPNIF